MNSSANTSANTTTIRTGASPNSKIAFRRLCWKEARQIAPLAIVLLAISLVLHLLPADSDQKSGPIGFHLLLLQLMPCLFAIGAGALLVSLEKDQRTIGWLSSLHREIQRSLLTENWPPEKLNELREMVSQTRFSSAKWKALFTCERAMFGDDVASSDLSRITVTKEASLVPLLQTGRLRIFEAYDELINVGNAELGELKSTSKTTIDRIIKRDATFDVDGANIWIGLTLPAIEQMARAMENEESNRRRNTDSSCFASV